VKTVHKKNTVNNVHTTLISPLTSSTNPQLLPHILLFFFFLFVFFTVFGDIFFKESSLALLSSPAPLVMMVVLL
jgi:hypothetical protein